jgi:hypothetical protein
MIDIYAIIHKRKITFYIIHMQIYISRALRMRPKHSHLRITFVKCEQKFCIYSQMASWYFRNIFILSPLFFFNLTSDFSGLLNRAIVIGIINEPRKLRLRDILEFMLFSFRTRTFISILAYTSVNVGFQ